MEIFDWSMLNVSESTNIFSELYAMCIILNLRYMYNSKLYTVCIIHTIRKISTVNYYIFVLNLFSNLI